MTVKTKSYGYTGDVPTALYGSGLGVFSLSRTADIRKNIGASGAAFGYAADSTTDYAKFSWLKAGESRVIAGTPYIMIWLPPGASGAVSNYVSYSPVGNFSGFDTFTLKGYSVFASSQNIAGSYGNTEWPLFSISSSTNYFAPQYALISGKFTRFSSYGGTISLV